MTKSHTQTQTLITLKGISKQYADQVAIAPLDLCIEDGEFLTLLGPSGCGKTTLLRILSGFETPDQGQVILKGQNITQIPPEQRHVNMVFQSYALFPHMSVFQNIAFGLQCQKLAKHDIETKVTQVLQRVRLSQFRDRKPHQLSGGQQQRVAIARAIVNEPLMLLLDEPLSALDYGLRKQMRLELKALQRRLGITFILVTHDQEEALTLSDRIVVMNNGHIEQIGKPRDVYEEPSSLFVTRFIGEANIFTCKVLTATAKTLTVEIAEKTFTFDNPQNFQQNDTVHVAIRPEDIEAWDIKEIDHADQLIKGSVTEVIYKGSTVDLVIKLTTGQLICATEFFNEDDENLEYELGETVYIEWKSGWEVILPHEN